MARGTGADLLASGLFGIWKDRTDITDSFKFARELRRLPSSASMADPTLPLHSDVRIDFFRGSPQAADWLSANSDEVIGIPAIVLGVLWSPQEIETARGRV